MRTRYLLLLAVILICQDFVVALGQSNPFRQSETQILSPNAAELGKYGKIPVNYFNGLPNITVPLTEVYAKGYTLPIYLTYHASGNKPDQHPGWVGLGWSLHAGGFITRIINGKKDELSKEENGHYTGTYLNYDPGYLYRANSIQTNTNWTNLDSLYYNCFAGGYKDADNEPDEFIVNLEGLQASFYITGDGEVKIVSRSDASFDVNWTLGTDSDQTALTVYECPTDTTRNYRAHRYKYLKSFTLRDREGTVYHFGGKDDAIEYSVAQRPFIYYDSGTYRGGSTWDATATANTWMLTKIERPDGEVILFSYKHEDSVPIVVHDFHYGDTYSAEIGNEPVYASYDTYAESPSSKNNLSVTFLLPCYLQTISCRVSGDSLSFGSSPSTELEYTLSQNDFELRVGYFGGWPYPLSYNDFQSKNYYLKLDTISGSGRNLSLSYTNSGSTRLKLTSVNFLNGAGGATDHQYQFVYNSTPLPGYNARQSDRWGYYNGVDYTSSIGNYAHNMYDLRAPDATYMQAEILTEIKYPTGGKTIFEYEPHTYYRIVNQTSFSVENCQSDMIAGGLRIKSITDITGNTTADKRVFTYTGTYSGSTHSSGVLSGRQTFYIHGTTTLYTGFSYIPSYELTYTSYNELPFNQLSDTDGNHVTYSYVTETHPDGGNTVYHYSNHETTFAQDNVPSSTLSPSGSDLSTLLKFNSGELFRGLLLDKELKNSSGTTVIHESYGYDTSRTEYLKSVFKRILVSQIGLASMSEIYCGFPCLQSKTVVTTQDSGSAITETYNYQYNTDRRKTKETHTRTGNQEDGTVTFYPSDRSGNIYTSMQQAGMSGVPVGQASLLGGNVVAAQELTYKLSVVETASGSKYLPVPEALYSAELSSPVSLSTYSASPSAYLADPDVEYLRYDGHANLTGTRTRDGIGSAYFWDASGLHPVLVARGLDPGETSIQDQDRQKYYSLTYPTTSSFSDYFTTSGASTITFSFQTVYGYDWLYEVSVDSQTGRFVVVAAFETPPAEWIQYTSQYPVGSIQFSLPAGTHHYTLTPVQVRKVTGSASSSAGSILCTYKEQGQTLTAGEPLLLVDFEDEATTLAGCHGQHCHAGAYTLNQSVGTTRNYVLDYMLYENGAWSYHRQSYSGGSLTLGGSGKYLDDIRVFPADCDLATAGYDAAGLLTTRTDSRGVTEHYDYDGLRRLIRISDNAGSPVEDYAYNYAKSGVIHNSVTTKTYTAANNTGSYRTSVSYLDSLGRSSQQVLVNGAASGWDLITYQDYDACGREFRKWLPAPVQVMSGGHTAGAYASLAEIQTGGNQVYSSSDSYRYEQPVYEASPRDRITEAFGPGSAWRSGSGHRTRFYLHANVTSTSSPFYYRGFSLSWTGNTTPQLTRKSASGSGALQVIRTTDEDGQITLEFLNAQGKTVLIRKVYDSTTFLDTYYVYDDLGRLTAVLSPELLTHLPSAVFWDYNAIAGYAYLYRYDSRGNCIAKSLPGAGWTYTVYDKGNRPILTQDAAQRAQNANAWTFALPDRLGRPVLRGTATLSVDAFADPYKTTVVQADLPKTPTYSGTFRGYVLSGLSLTSPTLLEVDYYDAYGFAGTSPFPAANNTDFAYDSTIGSSFSAYYSPSAQGMQTGFLKKVLDNSTGNQYLWSVSYYDDRARVVQNRASTHLGGVEKDWFLYDFVGNTTKRKTEHKPSSGTSLIETSTQTYDTWGRPLITQHQIGSGTVQTVSNKTYDKVGRLASDTRNGNASLSSTHSYNIRSWVIGITGSLFSETLKYQDVSPTRWGGDVSKVSWTDGQSSQTKTYSFAYDAVGRLTSATFSDAAGSSINFSENVTGYDANGNITGMQRYGRTGASSYGLIDNLAYTYTGNKATSIKDTGSAAYSSDFRFSNGTNNTYSFSYDAAGRMTADASKGISSITWNVLGLPQTVTFSSGAVINYSYAADGTKLREARTASSTTTTTDYTGNLILENGTRSRLLFDGGYVSVSNSAYHFFLTDHLGSVRVVANTSGSAEEYNHYYPLGGPIAQYSSATSIQPLKFQGKEWGASKGLDLYDFGARRYDPATGRWLSQDPLSEKYYAHSPYLFCAANPIRFVDPTGADIWTINVNGIISWQEESDKHFLYFEDEAGKRTDEFIQISSPDLLIGLENAAKTIDGRRELYMSQSTHADDVFNVFKFAADHSNVEWVIHKNNNVYTLGTVLGLDSAASYQDFGLKKPDASVHSHPNVTPPFYKEELESMGYFSDLGIVTTDMAKVRYNQAPFYNYVYFPVSGRLYNLERKMPRFIRKVQDYHGFYFGTLNDR